MGITVISAGNFVKVIMVAVGCPRIVLETEPDPLTIPPPVFRPPRFGLRDHLIDRADQSYEFRLIQLSPLAQAKNGSLEAYRQMRVKSSGAGKTKGDTAGRPIRRTWRVRFLSFPRCTARAVRATCSSYPPLAPLGNYFPNKVQSLHRYILTKVKRFAFSTG